MDLARFLGRLWARRLLVAVAAGLSCATVVVMTYSISVLPPDIDTKQTSFGVGSAELLVDSEQSLLDTLDADVPSLASRAALVAASARSPAVRNRIARALEIRPTALSLVAFTQTSDAGANAETAAPSFEETGILTVSFVSTRDSPVVTIASSAPTGEAARRLAQAAQVAVLEFGRERARDAVRNQPQLTFSGERPLTAEDRDEARKLARLRRVALRELGAPSGEDVVRSQSLTRPAVTGIFCFGVLCVLILVLDMLLLMRRTTARAG